MKRQLEIEADINLIQKINSGDRFAMQEFIKRWNSDIYKRIYFLTNQSEISKDLCQEAWQSILKNIHLLKDVSKYKSWMLVIASRKAFDWIRSLKKNQFVSIENISEKELLNSPDDYEQIQNQHVSDIQNAIRELDSSQKIILELYYLNRMSLKEISSVLTIPYGTVKSRLFYAREELKRVITKEVHDET